MTEENYAGKPGHAVAIGDRWGSVSVGHVVVDWKAHGLRKIGRTGTVTGGKMTEAETAERRRVVANNKAWVSAEKVRRAWLARMLGRKRRPADALAFAAVTLAVETHEVGRAVSDHHALACELLGTDYTFRRAHPLAAQVTGTPTKAGRVILAIALAALEGATSKTRGATPTARTAATSLSWPRGATPSPTSKPSPPARTTPTSQTPTSPTSPGPTPEEAASAEGEGSADEATETDSEDGSASEPDDDSAKPVEDEHDQSDESDDEGECDEQAA